jgi:hypothetical protein
MINILKKSSKLRPEAIEHRRIKIISTIFKRADKNSYILDCS